MNFNKYLRYQQKNYIRKEYTQSLSILREISSLLKAATLRFLNGVCKESLLVSSREDESEISDLRIGIRVFECLYIISLDFLFNNFASVTSSRSLVLMLFTIAIG